MAITPFAIPYSESDVADLRMRLANTKWPPSPPGAAAEYGFPLGLLREICAYWGDRFDWKKQVNRLSTFEHFRYFDGECGIHFLHQRGRGPAPLPIILTHGWPGSFVEMLRLIPLLTDPSSYGGDPRDAFHVVVPSLPGYGFSDVPTKPGVNVFRIAEMWTELMCELGYPRFAAQGGDIGAGVTSALGLRHSDHLIGIHLNFIPGSYQPFLTNPIDMDETEKTFHADVGHWREQHGAYSHIQRTQPQTAAYGLTDSPVALAAWIVEKFQNWSDCGGDVRSRFTFDELLTNVSLYWMTDTIASSFWLYLEGAKAPMQFGPSDRIQVPCAVAQFPKELIFPPRAWVERGYNVHQWTNMPRGGHFAAWEEPDLLAEDIRSFFRNLR
jgi:pimeloyl-ACP methyl ester carboxylesterase